MLGQEFEPRLWCFLLPWGGWGVDADHCRRDDEMNWDNRTPHFAGRKMKAALIGTARLAHAHDAPSVHATHDVLPGGAAMDVEDVK